MRLASEPLDPRDPSPTGRGSSEITEAAERARKQLREDFEHLRAEIEEQRAAETPAGDSAGGTRFRGKARATFAAFALTAAVAAAAANFALNGGRTSKESDVSAPSASPEPEGGGITADRGSPKTAFPLLASIPPSLLIEGLGSSGGGGLPGAASPVGGPTALFVVDKLVPVSGHRLSGENVAGADPVGRPTAVPGSPSQPLPGPQGPPQLAYTPPPVAGGGGGGGQPGENPGGG